MYYLYQIGSDLLNLEKLIILYIFYGTTYTEKG